MKAAVTALEILRRTLAYPDWRGRLFYGLLRAIFAGVPFRRRLILDALKVSFPDQDERWRKATLRGIYRHFSWMIVEFLAAVNDPSLVNKMAVQTEGRDVLDRLKAEKKGCFILTGHFSNWEICGAWLPQNGYPMMPAVRDSDDPDFAELIENYRSSLGEKDAAQGNGERAPHDQAGPFGRHDSPFGRSGRGASCRARDLFEPAHHHGRRPRGTVSHGGSAAHRHLLAASGALQVQNHHQTAPERGP